MLYVPRARLLISEEEPIDTSRRAEMFANGPRHKKACLNSTPQPQENHFDPLCSLFRLLHHKILYSNTLIIQYMGFVLPNN